jgi:hypothetical protein
VDFVSAPAQMRPPMPACRLCSQPGHGALWCLYESDAGWICVGASVAVAIVAILLLLR